eukprot:snap_masked-scaffold_90-processed-gene-0.25-mRNA-1 protein AED:1.00 eAED:1.00 QI:0/-1/0/0/-1/1/1/0/251
MLWDWNSVFQLRDQFTLVTDKGSHFTAGVVEKFIKDSGCMYKFTATYVSHTAGAVEVQNRQILKHLRSLLSEFGLGNEDWPDILPMIQTFINQTPLTCRGSKLSPLQLMIGVDEKRCALGSVYKNMERSDFKKLEKAAVDLRSKLMILQKKASDCGLEYRAKNNLRRSGKTKPIFFHPGEYVWLSEKEVASGNKDKAKPRWCGPYQILRVISEYIYEVQDVDGKIKVRHSTLLIPFAPVGFLPNPATKLTY